MTAPTDPVSQPPTRSVCPVCGTAFAPPANGRCVRCRADLTHPAVARVLEIDARLLLLTGERDDLVAQVASTRAPAPLPPPPRSAPPQTVPPAPQPRPPSHLGVPTLLGLGGAALLVAAAVVFTAVAWSTLAAAAQAAILLAATVLAAVAAEVVRRRALPTAAAALGLVAMSFAAVDVVALDRGDIVALDILTAPVALVVASVAGWLLSRRGLGWVATAGAVAAVLAAIGFTLVVGDADVLDASVGGVLATGIVSAVLAAATAPVWPTRPARWVAAIGGASWMTIMGLVSAAATAAEEVTLTAGAALCVTVVVVHLLVARRWPATVAPAVLVATAATVGVAARLGATDTQLVAVAAGLVCAAAWAAVALAPRVRVPLLVGMAPAAAATVAATVFAAGTTWGRLSALAGGQPWEPFDPWLALVVLFAAAALLALPVVRPYVEWVAVGALVVTTGALWQDLAWPLLLGAATLVVLLRRDALAALLAAVVAVGWAAGKPWTLTLAAAAAAVLGGWTAARADGARVQAGTAVGLAAAGLGVGAGTRWAGADLDIALGVALAAVFVGAFAAVRAGIDVPPVVGPSVAALATLAVAVSATTPATAGVLLVVAAAGWTSVAVTGRPQARWVAAVAASSGTLLLLGDAGVGLVEAFTIVPVVTLGAAGIWWLAEDRSVSTVSALSPALLAGLVPSLLELSADPRVLGRTLGLTAAAGLLAVAGVRGRWLAPTIAGGLAAVWVAATQVTIVVEVVPRWVTFGVVGLLLVWLAATYERQQERRRTVARHLADYR